MSTRRARIKAVTALPPRRKNADNADNKKKQDQAKEQVENVIKTPKACRASDDKTFGSSPARAPLASPRKSPRDFRRTPDFEKVPPDRKILTPTPVTVEKRSTTPLQDKIDIHKSAGLRTDVFVSPQARASPLRRRSPIVRTPVIEVDLGSEKYITAHKRLLEIQEDANKYDKVRENVESPKSQSNTIPSCSKTEARNILDGYNSPSTPETSDVMDGIVPLKPVNAPKPIDLLKNEIISENAEVLFDPIVPLPSPTKVRPKLRPVPRLGPMRRNSIPGSTSESEDESRRALHGGASTPVPSRQRHDSHTSHSTMHSLPNRDVSRVRNDSVCSSVSQIAPQTPASCGSPLKEKNTSKSRRQEVSRRMAAIKRRKETVQRETLTMYDLIFYNPMTNPIVPDQDEIKAKEASKNEEAERKKEETSEETPQTETAPVPQIKLGPNGEIVLDEQSLVINQSEQRKLSNSVVREGAWVTSSGRAYRRTPRTADWSDAETVRFYRAVAAIGTDFTLMEPLFPGRTRRDLKLKFKKEEKVNLAQIDKALRTVAGWDVKRLEDEFTSERKLAEEQEKKEKERLQREKREERERQMAMKELRVRQSKGSRALGTSILPSTSAKSKNVTANDFIVQAVNAKKRRRAKKSGPLPRLPHSVVVNMKKSSAPFASLTPLNLTHPSKMAKPRNDIASLQKVKQVHKSPVVLNALPAVPADIAPGSLVVLTVDDPKAPSQKAIHTYIKKGDGSILSVILASDVMNSLVNYVQKDTSKAGSSASPASSDRSSVSASPSKRKRLGSYSITDL